MRYLAKIYPVNLYSLEGEYIGIDKSISTIKFVDVFTPVNVDMKKVEECLGEYFISGNIEENIWCNGEVVKHKNAMGDVLFELHPVFDDDIVPFAD